MRGCQTRWLPEYVGLILRRWVPGPVTDFQDIPLWRGLTAEIAVGLCREDERLPIVPMTLVDASYRDEIFALIAKAGVDLLHVFLDVPAAELRRRIDAQVLCPDDPERDAQAREFRAGNIVRCVAARSELPAQTLVLPGDLHTPDETADRVLDALVARGWAETTGACGSSG